MNKKYIAPWGDITICYLEHALLAGSVDPTKEPSSQLPDKNIDNVPEEKEDVDMGAKQFGGWSSWDE